MSRLSAVLVLFETELGLMMLEGEKVVFAQPAGSETEMASAYRRAAEELRQRGVERLSAASRAVQEKLSALNVVADVLTSDERNTLESEKVAYVVKAGFAPTQEQALSKIREAALGSAERTVSAESSREDLHLVQAISSLDEIDRALNISQERLSEWYGLHFPELAGILQDSLVLCRLIVDSGRRDQIREVLEGRGLSDRKIEAIEIARDRSKGGSISDKDLARVKGIGGLVLAQAAEREKLAEYVESAMRKIAPNVGEVAGSTIGARLIAKAGGLDRLARLPASTIQILGAEKALFRALRTGSRPPKHGILFQHEAVHTAPKWQRGKIARTLANKVAIAARIDYYRGEREGGLTSLLEKRLAEIRLKYKEPRKPDTSKVRRSFGKPFLRGKSRKEKRRH